MAKNKVKKFSIVDKKLRKFRNENNVQPNDPTVSRLCKCSQQINEFGNGDLWELVKRVFSRIKLSNVICSG